MTSIDNQSARMLEERLALSSERIRELITETDIAEPFGEYFRKLAQFIVFSEEIRKKRLDGSFYALSEKELEKINRKLYEDVLPDEEQEMHYSVSYANPAYAAEKLGEEYGPLWQRRGTKPSRRPEKGGTKAVPGPADISVSF